MSEASNLVLVHGLWLAGYAFAVQRRFLQREGFSPRTFSYPSVRHDLHANSLALSCFIESSNARTIDIVAHSLGGLVVLDMLALAPDPRIRRVVLMGSPTAGSHCAAVLLRTRGLAAIAGRTLSAVVMKRTWKIPPGVEVGVLAGDRGIGLGRLIPGLAKPNDGTVAVAETRLPGCCDEIVLPLNHSQMLLSHLCAGQVAGFLKSGRFIHG